MKTTLKFFGGLILLFGLGSCEVDEIITGDSELLNTAEAKAVTNFNNGMINSYSNETVLNWNELLSKSIDNSIPQPAEAKIYAMVTLAIHDALNNVVPKYDTYALDNNDVIASGITKKNIHSIADAAVSKAARDMMVQLFPASTEAADNLLNSTLSGIENSELKTRGIEIGRDASAAILAKRANDFPLRFETYIGGTEPGEFQSNFMPWVLANPPIWPANAVYAPKLGDLNPFGILSGDQFRDEVPNPLNSSEYLADYNEVKSLGCTACPLRTE
tara:strand:+ start:770 stop:1591 length:822 start_codon:yes stop_codon:yes gene_type:complete